MNAAVPSGRSRHMGTLRKRSSNRSCVVDSSSLKSIKADIKDIASSFESADCVAVPTKWRPSWTNSRHARCQPNRWQSPPTRSHAAADVSLNRTGSPASSLASASRHQCLASASSVSSLSFSSCVIRDSSSAMGGTRGIRYAGTRATNPLRGSNGRSHGTVQTSPPYFENSRHRRRIDSDSSDYAGGQREMPGPSPGEGRGQVRSVNSDGSINQSAGQRRKPRYSVRLGGIRHTETPLDGTKLRSTRLACRPEPIPISLLGRGWEGILMGYRLSTGRIQV